MVDSWETRVGVQMGISKWGGWVSGEGEKERRKFSVATSLICFASTF